MSDIDLIDNNPHIPSPFFYNLLRWILGIPAIFVAAYASIFFMVEMRSLFLKLSYKPLTEEAAMERAVPMKTIFPTTMQVMSGSDKKEIELKAGTPIKFIGACMKLLNNRVDGKTDLRRPSYIMSPRVYTPSQLFLIETEDGIRGAAFLPEAIIGRKLRLPKVMRQAKLLLCRESKKSNPTMSIHTSFRWKAAIRLSSGAPLSRPKTRRL